MTEKEVRFEAIRILLMRRTRSVARKMHKMAWLIEVRGKKENWVWLKVEDRPGIGRTYWMNYKKVKQQVLAGFRLSDYSKTALGGKP